MASEFLCLLFFLLPIPDFFITLGAPPFVPHLLATMMSRACTISFCPRLYFLASWIGRTVTATAHRHPGQAWLIELLGEAPHRSLLKSPPPSEPGLPRPGAVVGAKNYQRALLKSGNRMGHADIRAIFESQNVCLSSGVQIKGHSGASFVGDVSGDLWGAV